MRAISNKAISDYLDQQEIPHSKVGYQYLMRGLRALLDGKVDRYQVSTIYNYVASTTGVTPNHVDRAMRSVIRRCSLPATNKEFISKALDTLLLENDADADLFSP